MLSESEDRFSMHFPSVLTFSRNPGFHFLLSVQNCVISRYDSIEMNDLIHSPLKASA